MQSGSIPDLEEEVSCVPVAESLPSEALDHVVRAFKRAIGDGKQYVRKDAVHAFLKHSADTFQFRNLCFPCNFYEHHKAGRREHSEALS